MQINSITNTPNPNCLTFDEKLAKTIGSKPLNVEPTLAKSTADKLADPTLLEQRSVTLAEYAATYCHTFSDDFRKCPQKNCVEFLLKHEADTDPGVETSNSISAEEIYTFDRQIATNQQMTDIRSYINSHSKVMINNQAFEVEEITEEAPLLYQFFSKSKDSKILEDYVAIFKNNCDIEPERKTVILVDDYYTNSHDQAVLEGLADEFDNVSLFEFSELSEMTIGDFKVERNVDDQGAPYFSLKEHGKILNSEIPWHYLDISRFMALAKHDEIFAESENDEISGCIYIDFDFLLKKKIGSVKCAGGIAPFVMEKINPSFFGAALYTMKIENSLIGVSRPDHPAITGSLKLFIESCDDEMMTNTPYTSYEESLCQYFNHFTTDHSKLKMNKKLTIGKSDCLASYYLTDKTVLKEAAEKSVDLVYGVTDAWKQKIAFPVNLSMLPDISKILGVSTWKE